jgi:hypothetical protein
LWPGLIKIKNNDEHGAIAGIFFLVNNLFFYCCVCVICKLEQEQVSPPMYEDGMGGERNLEAGVVGQEMQVDVKEVATLVALKIVHEQMQLGGDVGETNVAYADIIEANLEKTILMIER